VVSGPVFWRLTGVSAADVVGGALSGVATTNGSGVATVAVELAADLSTEGTETMTMEAGVVSGSVAVTVSDTSLTPPRATFATGQTSYTYSNSNFTVTKNASNQQSIVAGSAYNAGKRYIEFDVTDALSNGVLFGLATGANATYLGNFASSVGVNAVEQYMSLAGAVFRRYCSAIGSGARRISLACDFDAKRLWIGVDGTYNGSGDPVAGTNPNIDSWTGAPLLYPALRCFGNGSVVTVPASNLYFPSGYSYWV
jgi:hypothetical protein